jgi:hypothetical protein
MGTNIIVYVAGFVPVLCWMHFRGKYFSHKILIQIYEKTGNKPLLYSVFSFMPVKVLRHYGIWGWVSIFWTRLLRYICSTVFAMRLLFEVRLLTKFVELIPSWDAASRSAAQEFRNTSWKPMVHCRVRKSPQLVPIRKQINPFHITPYYFSKIIKIRLIRRKNYS